MSFKEFYFAYGRDYPLEAVRTAYGYTLNGNAPKSSLGTATVLYVAHKKEKYEARRKENSLRHHAFVLAKCDNSERVRVYKLSAETFVGLRCLLVLAEQLKYDEVSENVLFARLVENCAVEPVCEIEAQKDRVFGLYAHGHRYVAVAKLAYDEAKAKSEDVLAVQKAAYAVAKNAVCYFQAFQDGASGAADMKRYAKWLCQQPVLLTPAVNNCLQPHTVLVMPSVTFPGVKEVMTIGDYLEKISRKSGADLRLEAINLFGF